MLISVYLNTETIRTLKCYGTLDYVTNRILQEWEDGNIDISNLPSPGTRTKDKRVNINITNEAYLGLLKLNRCKSSYSLRRILYWFSDNMIGEELCWEQVNPYQSNNASMTKHLRNAIAELTICIKYDKDGAIEPIVKQLEALL